MFARNRLMLMGSIAVTCVMLPACIERNEKIRVHRDGRVDMELSFKGDPSIDQVEINRRVLTASGQEDVEKLMAPPPEPDPMEQEMRKQQLDEVKASVEKLRSEVELNQAKVKEIGEEVEHDRAEMQLEDNKQKATEVEAEAQRTLSRTSLLAEVRKSSDENMTKMMAVLAKQGEAQAKAQAEQAKVQAAAQTRRRTVVYDDNDRVIGME